MNLENINEDYIKNLHQGIQLRTQTRAKIKQFEDYFKIKENILKNPRSEVNKHVYEAIDRVNSYLSDYVSYLNKFKDHVVSFIDSYRENAFSKLESINYDDVETIKKLLFNCRENCSDWNEIICNFNDQELVKILLEVHELEAKLYEKNDNTFFNTQRLHSCENKFYSLVHDYAIFYQNETVELEDKFYLDLNRLMHIKSGKVMNVGPSHTLSCHLFATYGGRFIAAWYEKNICKLQLFDVNENDETLLPVHSVTNSALEHTIITASDRTEIIVLVFTLDRETYWLKAYDTNLKELGIIQIKYKPTSLLVYNENILVIDDTKQYLYIYDQNLNETTLKKENESIIYYLKYFGNKIQFQNEFVFVLNEDSTLSIINQHLNYEVRRLEIPNAKFFKVDSLSRLIVFTVEPFKVNIYDLKGDRLHEFNLTCCLTSICVTDNGYLIGTSGSNGELTIF